MEDNLWLILIVLVTAFMTSQVSAKSDDDFESGEEVLKRFKRIVNGQTVREGQWPWLVHLKADVSYSTGGWWGRKVSRSVSCGGSIIANKWVLTAAHCVDDSDSNIQAELRKKKVWHVTAGETDWKCSNWISHFWGRLWGKPSQRCHVHVTDIHQHPEYKGGATFYWRNDMALMRLEDNILEKSNTDTITPCSMAGQTGEFPKEGDTGYAHGWGCTQVGGSPSASARGAEVNIKSNSFCQARFSSRYNTTAHMCAGGDGSSVCNGDSGGPLVVNWLDGRYCQAGVISFFVQNDASQPSGFARVSSSREWIRQVTGV